MTEDDRLVLLEADLDMLSPPKQREAQLRHLLSAASSLIEREGIVLADTVEDNQLLVMYAAYLYRKRASDNPSMRRMLRYALNNRLMSQKAGGTA